MNVKKKNNLFKRLLGISFIIFMGLYISSISGFYESKLSSEVALTNKAIEKFEQDIKDGKNVDVINYINDEKKDYSNKFTDSGEKFSEVVTKILTEGFSGAWDAVKVLLF